MVQEAPLRLPNILSTVYCLVKVKILFSPNKRHPIPEISLNHASALLLFRQTVANLYVQRRVSSHFGSNLSSLIGALEGARHPAVLVVTIFLLLSYLPNSTST